MFIIQGKHQALGKILLGSLLLKKCKLKRAFKSTLNKSLNLQKIRRSEQRWRMFRQHEKSTNAGSKC